MILLFFLCFDIRECAVELYFLIICFLSLDAHYFLYRVYYIKIGYVLPELAGFDLSEIEQVLNDEAHDAGGVFLDFEAFF